MTRLAGMPSTGAGNSLATDLTFDLAKFDGRGAYDRVIEIEDQMVLIERERLLRNFDRLKDMMNENERAAVAAVLFIDDIVSAESIEKAKDRAREKGWIK